MNDNDIKDVLHERAISVAPPTDPPATLKRRMRRRQGANLLGVAVVVALIAVGSLGAWRTFSPLGREGTNPAGPGNGGTASGPRIASLPLGQIEVPEGWWVTSATRDPRSGQPSVLQMTNYQPALPGRGGGCGGQGGAPPGGASLSLVVHEEQLTTGPTGSPASPRVLEDASDDPSARPDPHCATYQVAQWWSVDNGTGYGTHYVALAAISEGGPDADVLQQALDSLKLPGEYQAPTSWPRTGEPVLWVGQGDDPQPWALTAFQEGGSPRGDAYLMSLDSGGALYPAPVGQEVPGFGRVDETDGGTLYGTVAAEAAEIAVELPDGGTIPGQLFPVPSSLWGPAQAFVLPAGDAVDSGFLVARDATGAVLGSVPLSNGGATGDSRYGPWSLTSTLKNTNVPLSASPLQLHIDGGTHDVGDPLKDPGATMIDPQALVLGHITGAAKDGRYEVGTLVFGSLGSDVASVEFRSDDDGSATQAQILSIYGAEGGWRGFGLVTDAESGVVTARDSSGEVLEQHALEPFVNSDDPADFVLVVAEGSQGGTSWRMVVPDPSNPSCIGVDSFTVGGGATGGCVPQGAEGLEYRVAGLPGVNLVYGAVTPGDGVDVTTADGTTVQATAVRCPCGQVTETDYFYAELPPASTANGKLTIVNTPPAPG